MVVLCAVLGLIIGWLVAEVVVDVVKQVHMNELRRAITLEPKPIKVANVVQLRERKVGTRL